MVAHPRQRGAQIPRKVREHGAPCARVALAEAPHIGESVEQEMRLDLRLQEAQLRLELLLLECRALQLGGVDLFAHRPRVQIEDVAHDQHRRGNKPGDERIDHEHAARHRRGDGEGRFQPAGAPCCVQNHERDDQHRDAVHHEYGDTHQPGQHHVAAAAADDTHMGGEHRFERGQGAKRQDERQRAPREPVDQRGGLPTFGGSDGHRRH